MQQFERSGQGRDESVAQAAYETARTEYANWAGDMELRDLEVTEIVDSDPQYDPESDSYIWSIQATAE